MSGTRRRVREFTQGSEGGGKRHRFRTRSSTRGRREPSAQGHGTIPTGAEPTRPTINFAGFVARSLKLPAFVSRKQKREHDEQLTVADPEAAEHQIRDLQADLAAHHAVITRDASTQTHYPSVTHNAATQTEKQENTAISPSPAAASDKHTFTMPKSLSKAFVRIKPKPAADSHQHTPPARPMSASLATPISLFGKLPFLPKSPESPTKSPPDSIIHIAVIRRDSSVGYFPDDWFTAYVNDSGQLMVHVFIERIWVEQVKNRSLAVVSNLASIQACQPRAISFFHNRSTSARDHPGEWTLDSTVPDEGQILRFLHRLGEWDVIVSLGVDALGTRRSGFIAMLPFCKPSCRLIFLLSIDLVDFAMEVTASELLAAVDEKGQWAPPAAHCLASMMSSQLEARQLISQAKQLQLINGGIQRVTIGEKRAYVIEDNSRCIAAYESAKSGESSVSPMTPISPSIPQKVVVPRAAYSGGASNIILGSIADARKTLTTSSFNPLKAQMQSADPSASSSARPSRPSRTGAAPKSSRPKREAGLCALCGRSENQITNNDMCATCDNNMKDPNIPKKPCSTCGETRPIVAKKNPKAQCIKCLTDAEKEKMIECAGCGEDRMPWKPEADVCRKCHRSQLAEKKEECQRCHVDKLLNYRDLCQKCNAADLLEHPRPCLRCETHVNVMTLDVYCTPCQQVAYSTGQVDEFKEKAEKFMQQYREKKHGKRRE